MLCPCIVHQLIDYGSKRVGRENNIIRGDQVQDVYVTNFKGEEEYYFINIASVVKVLGEMWKACIKDKG
ncbi:hypothetical protein ACET3Z_030895 [Daucus carota]